MAAQTGSGIAADPIEPRDEPTAQMILAAENLGSRLLLGPGTHCATPPGFDFTAEPVTAVTAAFKS